MTNVCIDCAEGVSALPQVAEMYPFVGASVELKWFPHARYVEKRKVYEKRWMPGEPEPPHHFETYPIIDPTKQYARVSIVGQTCSVACHDQPPHLTFKFDGASKIHTADNVFMAWSMIKHFAMNPPEDVLVGQQEEAPVESKFKRRKY